MTLKCINGPLCTGDAACPYGCRGMSLRAAVLNAWGLALASLKEGVPYKVIRVHDEITLEELNSPCYDCDCESKCGARQ